MANVVLERVSRVFAGGVIAVDQLDLDVRDGELLVLVGPSGCGKTTTLRLIAGLEPLSSGDIQIAGRSVKHLAPRDRDVAMVFQGHALYPHLTVYQNLAFGLELRRGGWLRRLGRRCVGGPQADGATDRGVGGDNARPAGKPDLRCQIAPRVLAAAGTLGIEPLLDRMPGELSGGERQRVALGRALVRQPAVFLLDEPLSNLDALLRAGMRSELKRLHQTLATTMLYVTHDQTEALSLGDRIAVLDHGRMQQIGEPLAVYRQPANRFVAGFLGSPPMNLIEAELAHRPGQNPNTAEGGHATDRAALHGGGWTIEIDRRWLPAAGVPGRRVVWGVRPEDVHLGPPPAGEGRLVLVGQVGLIEPLGDAAIVHLSPPPAAGRDTPSPADPNRVLLSKTNDLDGVKVGERVEAWFEAARLHGFDALTGRSLRGFEASKGN